MPKTATNTTCRICHRPFGPGRPRHAVNRGRCELCHCEIKRGYYLKAAARERSGAQPPPPRYGGPRLSSDQMAASLLEHYQQEDRRRAELVRDGCLPRTCEFCGNLDYVADTMFTRCRVSQDPGATGACGQYTPRYRTQDEDETTNMEMMNDGQG